MASASARRTAAHLVSFGLAILVVTAVASCGGTTPAASQSSAAPSVAATATPKPTYTPAKVALALLTRSAIQWPYFVAQSQGIYKDLGLEVTFVDVPSETDTVKGLLSGSINIGSATNATLAGIANGSTNLALVGLTVDRPIYTLVTTTDITSFADLKGKRVGVSSRAATDGVWMRQLLQAKGLDPDNDVQIVEIGGGANRLQALKTRGVAATFLGQPADLQALREGLKALAKSTDIVKSIAWESLCTTRSWAKANEDAIVRFLAAERRAAQWLYDPKNRDAAIAILVKETNATQADAAGTYDLWIPEKVLAANAVATPAAVQASIDLIKSTLPKPVTVEDILDNSYMEKAAKIAP